MAKMSLEDRAASPTKKIHENVETIASMRTRAEEQVGAHQRGIENLTAALGRPLSIYVSLVIAAAWALYNGCASRLGIEAPDPLPCQYLQGVIALAALLMTTMVLTTQNRQSKHAEQRAHLDLQVNLLAEQKVAKLIGLLEELRRDSPAVRDRVDRVAEEMTEPLDPNVVMTALERTLETGAGDPDGTATASEDRKGGTERPQTETRQVVRPPPGTS
jgi:uncharacterized membrane protein